MMNSHYKRLGQLGAGSMCELSYLLKSLDRVVAKPLTVKKQTANEVYFLFCWVFWTIVPLEGPCLLVLAAISSSFRICSPQAPFVHRDQGRLTEQAQPQESPNNLPTSCLGWRRGAKEWVCVCNIIYIADLGVGQLGDVRVFSCKNPAGSLRWNLFWLAGWSDLPLSCPLFFKNLKYLIQH